MNTTSHYWYYLSYKATMVGRNMQIGQVGETLIGNILLYCEQ